MLDDSARSAAPSIVTAAAPRNVLRETAAHPRLIIPPLQFPMSKELRCHARARLLSASLPGLLEAIEQAACAGSRERIEAVRLPFLDRVPCNRPLGTEEFRFLLHLAVPPVLVELADVHEHAH